MSRRKWGVAALAGAGAGVAITSAIRLGGRHLRARTNAELDAADAIAALDGRRLAGKAVLLVD